MEKTCKVCDLPHPCPAMLIKLCGDLGSWTKDILGRKGESLTKDIVGNRAKTFK